MSITNEFMLRVKESIINAIAQLPAFLVGLACFWVATGQEPSGTLIDFRVKMLLVSGKSFMALYLGQILWNLLFPLLDEKKLEESQVEAKTYNIMYGRLILHAIMQMVFYSV